MYYVQRPLVTSIESGICAFHKKHPGHAFPGCTCWTSYSTREKTWDEMTEEEVQRYVAALGGEKPEGTPLW